MRFAADGQESRVESHYILPPWVNTMDVCVTFPISKILFNAIKNIISGYILYFFYKDWYNIIGQYKKTGIYYYCNIASPFLIEEDTIKYIDYDLDLRVFPDGSFKVLDRGEYKYHKKLMNYPDSIDKIIKSELSKLIDLARNKDGAFQYGEVERYCKLYEEIKNRK